MSQDPQIARLIRQDVQSMHAYAVQDAAGYTKLDAMENPHRLPAHLQAELGKRLGAVALNRYPGPRIDDLRRALARQAQRRAQPADARADDDDAVLRQARLPRRGRVPASVRAGPAGGSARTSTR